MEWALFALGYLKSARFSAHDDFNDAMQELRDYRNARGESWYSKCKNIIPSLYHYSMEFVSDGKIPGERFSSPTQFADELIDYRLFVEAMASELDEEEKVYKEKNKVDSPPFLISLARERVLYILGAIDYVASKKPNLRLSATDEHAMILHIASRFHESVLSLKKHPHGGTLFMVGNEWDCQYLFRSILAAYFRDIRDEEWNPSLAGSAARCEFFLKPLHAMVELKYVRSANDQKKIKQELLADLGDYGGNPQVDYVLVLIYDPENHLADPVPLQADLSGPNKGLKDVQVVVSPPR